MKKGEMTTEKLLLHLEEIHHLMTLKGENPFKIRAFEKAIRNLTGRSDLKERVEAGTLTELDGIGKGISEVITEFFNRGESQSHKELSKAVSPELIELTRVPGLGPKKALELIDTLGIKTLGELEYACRENRLLKLKGFGEKTQKQILEGVGFLTRNQGRLRIADALILAGEVRKILVHAQKKAELRVEETGGLRRRLETLTELSFLIELDSDSKSAESVKKGCKTAVSQFSDSAKCAIPISLHFAPTSEFGYELARTTASPDHWKALGLPRKSFASDERDFFKKLSLPWIAPELRETGEEVELAKKGKLDSLLAADAIQGVFHMHTVWSDGMHSTEQMVQAARKLGYRYIGISDHSQSAFYAHGLKGEDLKTQEKEIRHLQEKYDDIKIFWGIESDILADGSLDYDEPTLKKFDFVIASIHSRFQMDREAMTARILKAIGNPYTRFIGHITGRLLLDREGYQVDMEKLIAEAANHNVAIEINAHPARLDIDWRWGKELRKSGTLVSINPDAHEMNGLEDTRFGVITARKALLPKTQVLNVRSAAEVEKWLHKK